MVQVHSIQEQEVQDKAKTFMHLVQMDLVPQLSMTRKCRLSYLVVVQTLQLLEITSV